MYHQRHHEFAATFKLVLRFSRLPASSGHPCSLQVRYAQSIACRLPLIFLVPSYRVVHTNRYSSTTLRRRIMGDLRSKHGEPGSPYFFTVRAPADSSRGLTGASCGPGTRSYLDQVPSQHERRDDGHGLASRRARLDVCKSSRAMFMASCCATIGLAIHGRWTSSSGLHHIRPR